MTKTYALSLWIANFGVVPWLSFAFFLFLPEFFSLFFLFALVCVVFEDILYSLRYFIKPIYRGSFLSRIASLVKIFLPTTLCVGPAFAQKQDIFLSKGEQMELNTGKLKNFSVGNKEVLKYKYLPTKSKILIKGKSLGFSDLVIWNKSYKKKTYHFYITSKKEQLKKMEVAQILKGTQLNTKISGGIIYVEGKLNSISHYLVYKNLEHMKMKSLILNVDLSTTLKNLIIGKVYRELYDNGFNFVSCKNISAQINCEYNTETNAKESLNRFSHTYKINFTNLNNYKLNNNYRLKFKIVSIESSYILMHDSGASKIQSSIQDIISDEGFSMQSNKIFLEGQNYRAKLVASPEVNTVLEQKFKLELGGEIPFKKGSKENQSIDWKFVGLRVKGELKLRGDQYFLKYQSLITKGNNKGISGPKGESALYLKIGKLVKLYSIDFVENNSQEVGIPGLSSIPLLKHLFIKANKNHGHQQINVYVTIEEVSHD